MSDYRLKYTGAEIEERLGKVDILEDNQVVVSNDVPSKGSLWIDIDEDDEVILAEINDNDVSDEKTWSSKKINELNDKLTKEISDRQNAINNIKIPSLDGYATENYVQGYAQPKGNYLTQHQDISGKQNKTDNNLKTNSKDVIGAINEISDGVVEINNSIDVIGYKDGLSIVVNDSADASFLGMKLYGKTTQRTTSGKNLLENTAITSEYSGVKFTVNNDKSVTTNGTNNSDSALFFTIGEAKLGAGKYILSANLPNGYNSTDNALLTDVNYEFYAGDTPKEFTISEERTVTFYYRIQSGITVNNVTLYPMIRLASITDPTYEPFTGGQPAPNPQFQQPLESKGKWGNLLKNTLTSQTIDGVTLDKKDDETIVVNGTPTNDIILPIGESTLKKGEKYKISGCPSGGSASTYYIYKEYGSSKYIYDVGGSSEFTEEFDNETTYVYLVIENGTTLNNLTFKPQITYAEDNITSYRPYSGQCEVESGVYGKNLVNLFGTTSEYTGCEVLSNGTLVSTCTDTRNVFYFALQSYKDNKLLRTITQKEVGIGYHIIPFTITDDSNKLVFKHSGGLNDIGVKFDFLEKGDFILTFTVTGANPSVVNGLKVENIMIRKAEITDGTYEPYTKQSHISLVGDGLKGIPVTDSSLATYTDEDGKMICSDVTDYGKGVDVQRIYEVEFDGSDDEPWVISAIQNLDGCTRFDLSLATIPKAGWTECLCTHFRTTMNVNMEAETCWFNYEHTRYFDFRIITSKVSTVAELRALLQENPMKVQYILAEPIEKQLTASEIESYKSLHSNYGVTAIINDCDTYTEIDYFKNSPNGTITGQLYTENVELKSKLSALEETVNSLVTAMAEQ